LYKRTRRAAFLQPLSDAEKAELLDMEDRALLADTLAFRASALAQVQALKSKQHPASLAPSQAPPPGKGVGAWVRGWVTAAPAAAPYPELTEEERAEIERAIEFLDTAPKTLVPDSTLNVVVKVRCGEHAAAVD
jgi:hypothetical protein